MKTQDEIDMEKMILRKEGYDRILNKRYTADELLKLYEEYLPITVERIYNKHMNLYIYKKFGFWPINGTKINCFEDFLKTRGSKDK